MNFIIDGSSRQSIKLGIDHIYEEFPGGHEGTYWAEHIKRSFEFFDHLAILKSGHTKIGHMTI